MVMTMVQELTNLMFYTRTTREKNERKILKLINSDWVQHFMVPQYYVQGAKLKTFRFPTRHKNLLQNELLFCKIFIALDF